MKCIKEGSVLIFENNNKDMVSYDLKDGKMYKKYKIGKYAGKFMQVQTINNFFIGHDLFDIEFADEKYQKFINKIAKINHKCSNIGTFLNRLKQNAHLENYVLLNLNFHHSIRKPTSIYKKDILKILKKYSIHISCSFEETYNSNPNLISNILRHLDRNYSENEKFIKDIIKDMNSYWVMDYFLTLIINYKYEYKRLIDVLYYYNQNEVLSINRALSCLKDYARMQSAITKKYKKYPKYLKTMHDIVVSNYNTFKKAYSEEIFKKRINLDLEYKNKNFSILYPKSTKEIKQEGINLNHCVASYIERVVEGKTHILFLRANDDLEESLVTIEVYQETLSQAQGEYSRNINNSEKEFLEKYCKVKNLKFKVF